MPANPSSINRFSRTVPALSPPEYIDIKRPKSLFDLVESRFEGLPSLHRILSQIRALQGETIVIEKVGASDDLREENEDIAKRGLDLTESASWRMGFFKQQIDSTGTLAELRQDCFLGYAVIKHDRSSSSSYNKTRIFESVVKQSCRENNYIRKGKPWGCLIAGNPLSINGYLYAQQNKITNVCAHVALRTTAASFHKDGDISYREINNILGIDHTTKTVEDGLNTSQMEEVLKSVGANCSVINYQNLNMPVSFRKWVYSSVESGFPAIVCFAASSVRHAIPIFGHTFNEDTWVPSADISYFRVGARTSYIPSESWVSMFVGHDDNFGSNFCIPQHYMDAPPTCTELTVNKLCPVQKDRVEYVIATFPKEVKTNAVEAEVIGADYLFTILQQLPSFNDIWIKRLKIYAKINRLVLRPILIEGAEYVKHMNDVCNWDGKKFPRNMGNMFFRDRLKEKFWMIELSIPELFSANKRKVGEVIIRAEESIGTVRNFNSFFFSRLPSCFAFYDGGGTANPKYAFIRNGVKGHIELFGCEESVVL